MPEDFSLEANFARATKTEKFISFFKKLVQWRDNLEAESLMCIGRDDKNIETIFNAESFVQKIEVQAQKDSQGMYDSELILDALMKKVGG